jgi:chromate transporter
VGQVTRSAIRLGLTSFGGPIAHLGYFHREYVERRHWLDDAAFAELVALCQALPGPASSQLGIAIGWRRAGMRGAIAAWLGFTLPAVIVLTALALVARGRPIPTGLTHGLSLAAVAIVTQAVVLMARRLTPDAPRRLVAGAAAVAALVVSTPFSQVGLIAGGAIVGLFLPRRGSTQDDGQSDVRDDPTALAEPALRSRVRPILALVVLVALLIGLPVVRQTSSDHVVALVDAFFRTGALVFGGGHVILPLLQAAVVDPGWVGQSQFLAGYGAAQAVPGPLFSFAAYLGAIEAPPPDGLIGAGVALGAIYLPSFLLLAAALPTWDRFRARLAPALTGINAVVVGILAAALVDPLWTGSVHAPADVVIAAACLGLLGVGRVPPLVVVAAAAGTGLVLGG